MRELPPCPLIDGYRNPDPSSMTLALLEAELERRPYVFLGAYFLCLKQARRRQQHAQP